MTHRALHALLASTFCLAPLLPARAADAASAPPSGRPPGPPPEAVAACLGKTEGTQVSFVAHGERLGGICQKIGDTLAARPVGGPPPGQDGRPPQR